MRKDILILAGILSLTLNINSLAEAQEGKVIKLGEIIVTASRAERKLLEVPASVSVVSEKEIKASNAKSIPDLLKDLKGIYIYDASGVGMAGRINMRGFWGGMSSHQLILVDGIPQNKGGDKLVDWNLIPLDNIERVEVVRGPASALYGDNAMSGVINIITKRSSDIPETKIAASYGSYNTQNYNLSASRTLKRIGYYFGAGGKSTDGFRKHCNYNNIHLDGKLNYLINDLQKLKLSLDYHGEERGAYPWALSETQIGEDRRQARPGTENDKLKNKKINLGIIHSRDISDFSNMEETFYYRSRGGEGFYTSGSLESSTREQLESEDTCGFLLRLNTGPKILGREHFFTTGIDLERNNFGYEEYTAPYQVRSALRQNYKVIRDKIGPYIQDEIKILEPLKIILGMRYDLVQFDFTDRINGSNSKKEDMSKATPRCGIVYTYRKNSNFYANYTQAFRTPTIGQMFTYGASSNPDLNPEEAVNCELGMHHQFNDYLGADFSLYWMRLDNEIWYDYAEKKYKNYGKTSHAGAESSLDLKITEALFGFANYTYTRAKNESGNYAGKYLSNIPIHKGSVGLRLETKFGLKANLIVTGLGDSYLDSANDDKLSAYTTVDTKISYGVKDRSVFLAVNNLLDRTYNSYGYKSSTGMKYFNPAAGRTVSAGLEVKF